MQMLYPLLLVFLVAGPVLLAWLKGDQILNRLMARRQRRQRRQRQKSTRALPLREEVLQTLLDAEDRRDRLDLQVGQALSAFRRLSGSSLPLSPQNAVTALNETEQLLLTREAHFNTCLDLAWLQSETIERMVREVDLLREMIALPAFEPADRASSVPAEGQRPSSTSARPTKKKPSNPSISPAVEHLLHNLDLASRKRSEVDRKLGQIGAERGSRFEATVE